MCQQWPCDKYTLACGIDTHETMASLWHRKLAPADREIWAIQAERRDDACLRSRYTGNRSSALLAYANALALEATLFPVANVSGVVGAFDVPFSEGLFRGVLSVVTNVLPAR